VFRDAGYEPAATQPTKIAGRTIANVMAEILGSPMGGEAVIVGAHYDTVPGSPGANDNGSGVAVMLEVARACAGQNFRRTVQFVAFYNEESVSPWGAQLYARDRRARGYEVTGVICLETLGYYTDAPDTQKYPAPFSWFYPSTGNFLGFVGNLDSRPLVRECVASFRSHAKFPSRGAALPAMFEDAARSDHSAFWAEGYPGLMVTDTANFRYPYYHTPGDTPDKIDYDRLARVTEGLIHVVEDVANR
jgi:Zn-dependent M28 family amino/carboxypeptidase